MVQARPEIHRDGPDLDLHAHIFFPVGKEYRNLDDHMVTAVSVDLRASDIILYHKDIDIILAC